MKVESCYIFSTKCWLKTSGNDISSTTKVLFTDANPFISARSNEFNDFLWEFLDRSTFLASDLKLCQSPLNLIIRHADCRLQLSLATTKADVMLIFSSRYQWGLQFIIAREWKQKQSLPFFGERSLQLERINTLRKSSEAKSARRERE